MALDLASVVLNARNARLRRGLLRQLQTGEVAEVVRVQRPERRLVDEGAGGDGEIDRPAAGTDAEEWSVAACRAASASNGTAAADGNSAS